MSQPQAPAAQVQADFDRRYLFLALVPLGVYALLYFIYAEIRNAGITFDIIPIEQFSNVAHAELKYRYFWISAFLVSSAVSVSVMFSCAMSLYRETPPRHKKFIIIAVLLLIVGIIIFEWFPGALDRMRWYEYMGAGLYKGSLGEFPITLTLGATDMLLQPDEDRILRKLDIGLNFVKMFGATALIIIGVASILTLSRITGEKIDDPEAFQEQTVTHLSRNIALLKGYLYQGSIVYVFAVIAMISWMFWPIPFLDGPEVRAAYRELLVGSAIIQGVGYTLAVAAVYVPPAVLLRQRVGQMVEEAITGKTAVSADKWLRERGLHFQPIEAFRQFLAVLLPTLISMLPALMKV